MNSSEQPFSHLDETGQIRMVDVGNKPIVARMAMAQARLTCKPETLAALRQHGLPKGDVLATARLAGVMAAKRTTDLIPLCHALPLNQVSVDFEFLSDGIEILTSAKTSARTGVEMEALTAASVAALTLYDMMKAVDQTMQIDGIRVVQKIKSEA